MKCYVCQRDKPKSSFSKDATRKSGYCNKCKVCHREYKRKWRNTNNSKIKSYNSRRRFIKSSSSKKYGSFDEVDWDYVKSLFGCCLRCGSVNRLTPDHVVPLCKKGINNITNIQPLCYKCNSSKGSSEIDYRGSYLKKYLQLVQYYLEKTNGR